MQKGDFKPEYDFDGYLINGPKPYRDMTEAQGERIIQLLEQLVANGTPGSPQFNEALDKAISNDYRNVGRQAANAPA